MFAAGDTLPVGVEAFAGMEPNDLVLWVPSRAAVVTGDTLVDRGRGLEFPTEWADKGVPAAEILAGLQPLLDLPVEVVLPTHGPRRTGRRWSTPWRRMPKLRGTAAFSAAVPSRH